MADKLEKKDIAELLLKKYGFLREEIHLQIGNFKRHTKHVQLVTTILISGATYLIVDEKFPATNTNMFAWLVAWFIATSLICYLVYDVLDPMYIMGMLAARLAQLEGMINEIAESKLLIWESEVTAKVLFKRKPFNDVWSPGWLLIFYLSILGVVLVCFSFFLGWYLWRSDIHTYACIKRVLILGNVVFSIFSAYMIARVALGLFGKLRIDAHEFLKNAVRPHISEDT